MCILAADKRLFLMFFEKLLDCVHRRVHLTFHITGRIVASVMAHAFIMHQPIRIHFPEKACHLVDYFSAKRFVSTGPDKNRRMIFISLITGVHTIQHDIHPLFFVIRYDQIPVRFSTFVLFPASMGLQIIFRDQIKAINITQLIQIRIVRIMTGTDRIDIVLLHRANIFYHFLTVWNSSRYG